MSNVLIIRLSSLGDIIHTLPAFSALREARPESRITWLVEEKGRPLLELVPGLDRILSVRKSVMKKGAAHLFSELRRIRRNLKVDEQDVLDFQGLLKSSFYALLSGSKKRYGFHGDNLKEPSAGLFYTRKHAPLPPWIHVIDKNLKLLELLGIQAGRKSFPLTIPENASRTVKSVIRGLGRSPEDRLVVMNVGAAWETKRWYPDRWSDLIRKLGSERKDLFPLLLWGTKEEKALAEAVQAETDTPLVPELTIAEVLALIREADMVISGDSFPLQASCALDTPVVALFGPTHPGRNGPIHSHDRVIWHELDCSHCYRRKCPSPKCLDAITSDEVAGMTFQVLKEL